MEYFICLLHDIHVSLACCKYSYNHQGLSWSWLYGSWIYNYLCNQCLSPLILWVGIPFRRGVLNTTLCDKVCQWLATGRWFSQDTPVSFTNKTNHHDITEMLLKVALNTITLTPVLHDICVIGTDCIDRSKYN